MRKWWLSILDSGTNQRDRTEASESEPIVKALKR